MGYSDPVENLHAYVMVHEGIDRHERLADVRWVREVVNAARDVTNSFGQEQDKAIDKLRKAVRANVYDLRDGD